MGRKLLLLAALSLAVAAWPVGQSPEEIAPSELAILFAAFSVVLAVQCGALWVIGRFAGGALVNVLVALVFAANAYHFAFLTLEARTTFRILLAGLAGLAAWALLRPAVPRALALLFAVVFTALSLGQYTYGRATLSGTEQRTTGGPGSVAVRSDRNVYFISKESLHSPYAFRRLYGIDDAEHVAYLKAEGFRVLDRSYSVDTSTRVAYQRIMEFANPQISPHELQRVFKSDNATFRSFRDGGYGIQFIYVSNYMNLNPALVDHAYPTVGFYICDNLPNNFFYIVCRKNVRTLVNRTLFGIKGRVSVADEIAHLKERIGIAAADKRPWLTISHIAFPKHTPATHRYDDASKVEAFREKERRAMPQVAENYRQIVSAIKAQDPEAVIVTFGDHGTWLTRGMDAAASHTVFTAEDFIEDRYGVMLAVYPADFCANRIFEGSSTALLAKSVIECLNGNDSPTPEDLERSRSVVYMGETVHLDRIPFGGR